MKRFRKQFHSHVILRLFQPFVHTNKHLTHDNQSALFNSFKSDTFNEDIGVKVNAENKTMLGASTCGCSVKESDNEA